MAESELLPRWVGFVQSAAASDEASDAVACVADAKKGAAFSCVILAGASLTRVLFVDLFLGHDLEKTVDWHRARVDSRPHVDLFVFRTYDFQVYRKSVWFQGSLL